MAARGGGSMVVSHVPHMTNGMPSWHTPSDFAERLERGEIWEDDRYAPLQLSVVGGVLFKGRPVTCWQVSFSPYDLQGSYAASLVAGSMDGDDWAALIHQRVIEKQSNLAAYLHDDS